MTVIYEDKRGTIYTGRIESIFYTGKDGEESNYCARSAKLEGKVLGICSSATYQSYKISKMVFLTIHYFILSCTSFVARSNSSSSVEVLPRALFILSPHQCYRLPEPKEWQPIYFFSFSAKNEIMNNRL